MTDVDAVALSQQGCEDAFRVLYDRYWSMVRGRCCRALQNEEDADDLAQDIFTKAWSEITRFRSDSAFPTWLHTITSNKIIDHLRRKRRGLVSVDLEFARDISIAASQVMRIQINDALSTLSEDEQACLHDSVSGYRPAEIAQHTNRSKGSVHRHLQGIRKKVRSEIQ